MPSAFAITTTTNSINLDADRKAEAVFTAFNATGRPLAARAELKPANPASEPWLSVVAPVQREFAIAAAEQYRVQIAVPTSAPAGSYTFGLDVVGIRNPDEDFASGPTVTFVVPEPIAPKKPFPWWILAVVGVVLIGAIVAVVVLTRTVTMPNVLEVPVDDAEAQVAAAGLVPGSRLERLQAGIPAGVVIASTPQAGEKVKPKSTAVLVVSLPSPTPEPTHTPTPAPTDTPVPTATSTATRTATPIASKYGGKWRNSTNQVVEVLQLDISTSGNSAKVSVWGNFRTILASGGLASQKCSDLLGSKPNECVWGQVDIRSVSDPLVAEFKSQDGRLVHQLTVTLLPNDTSKVSVAHRILLNGRQQSANAYLLQRQGLVIAPLRPDLIITQPFIFSERIEALPGVFTKITPVSP